MDNCSVYTFPETENSQFLSMAGQLIKVECKDDGDIDGKFGESIVGYLQKVAQAINSGR